MRKTNKKSSLSLSTQTVRSLQDSELTSAGGAGLPGNTYLQICKSGGCTKTTGCPQ